jgi:hypothetical protein
MHNHLLGVNKRTEHLGERHRIRARLWVGFAGQIPYQYPVPTAAFCLRADHHGRKDVGQSGSVPSTGPGNAN